MKKGLGYVVSILPKTRFDNRACKSTLRKSILIKQKKCAISKFSNAREIQVAHIIPKCINNAIWYDTNTELNCWLLGNGLHSTFDSFEWTVDIFSFLDFNVESDSFFKSFLVMKNKPKEGTSQLSIYTDTTFNIPIQYFPSLYAHYYTYLMKNFRGEEPDSSWKYIVETDLFRNLCSMQTTSEIKSYLMDQREKHWKVNNGAYVEQKRGNCTVVINQNREQDSINVVWDYYKFLDNSWEPLSSVSKDLLDNYLDFKEKIDDPDWTPK